MRPRASSPRCTSSILSALSLSVSSAYRHRYAPRRLRTTTASHSTGAAVAVVASQTRQAAHRQPAAAVVLARDLRACASVQGRGRISQSWHSHHRPYGGDYLCLPFGIVSYDALWMWLWLFTTPDRVLSCVRCSVVLCLLLTWHRSSRQGDTNWPRPPWRLPWGRTRRACCRPAPTFYLRAIRC
jgi:hypothetical protein